MNSPLSSLSMFSSYVWCAGLVSLEMRKRLQYRFEFWLEALIGSLGKFVLAYVVWLAIFSESSSSVIAGYSLNDMIAYYLVGVVVNYILTPDWCVLSEQVYRGEFSKYLLYPVSFRAYFFSQYLGKCLAASLQSFFLLISCLYFMDFSLLSLGASVITLGVAAGLFFATNFLVEMIVFWVDHVWSLVVSLNFVTMMLGGLLMPLDTFPGWASFLTKLLPFNGMVALPIATLTGRISMEAWLCQIAIAVLWLLFFNWLIARLWSKAKFKYAGVGI